MSQVFCLKRSPGGEDPHLNFISFVKTCYMIQDERWFRQSIKCALCSPLRILWDHRAKSSMTREIIRLHVTFCCLNISEFLASQILHMMVVIAKGAMSRWSMVWWLRVHRSSWSNEMPVMPIFYLFIVFPFAIATPCRIYPHFRVPSTLIDP
jgi:hypothetical protein